MKQDLEKILNQNKKIVKGFFDDTDNKINNIINNIINKTNLLMRNMQKYIMLVSYLNGMRNVDLELSSIIKSFNSIVGAYQLTSMGLYGSTKPLFRYSYEYLIIGKYYSVSKDEGLYKKWRNKEEMIREYDISLWNDIFMRIENKNARKTLNDLYKALCEVTHSNKFSQQISLNLKDYLDDNSTKKNLYTEILFCYTMMDLMLSMIFHLFTSTVYRDIRYYVDYYQDLDNEKYILKYKEEIKQYVKESKMKMSPETKSVLDKYINMKKYINIK